VGVDIVMALFLAGMLDRTAVPRARVPAMALPILFAGAGLVTTIQYSRATFWFNKSGALHHPAIARIVSFQRPVVLMTSGALDSTLSFAHLLPHGVGVLVPTGTTRVDYLELTRPTGRFYLLDPRDTTRDVVAGAGLRLSLAYRPANVIQPALWVAERIDQAAR
jgi:hypothetical protein